MLKMSRRFAVYAAVAVLAAAAVLAGPVAAGASNKTCIACTLIVGLLEESAIHVTSKGTPIPSDVLAPEVCNGDRACENFMANGFGDLLGSNLIAGASSESPDAVCVGLKFCTGQCTLFTTWPVVPPNPPNPPTPPHFPNMTTVRPPTGPRWLVEEDDVKGTLDRLVKVARAFPAIMDAFATAEASGATAETDFFNLMKMITQTIVTVAAPEPQMRLTGCSNLTCIIHQVFDLHLPLVDMDGDAFTPSLGTAGFRGGDWRGRDCNDLDPNTYAGRIDTGANPSADVNCNGISGNAPTGESYESMYCAGTQQRGIIILGDSATAHFHIPPEWLRARGWQLDNLLPAAMDELDWPQCSWSTGWQNTTNCPPSSLPLNSVYQRLRSRNLCNHRDFQNIGVNGARVTSMAPSANGEGIIRSLRRNQTNDNPALVFHALIGNDVCNGHPGMGSMTTPQEFETAVLSSLAYLDTTLPAGSHVVLVGLVDGRVLWNTMHDQIHPIGVGYPALYDYLSCTGVNPCWGWLNSNSTWRNMTTERAQSLNDVYSKIVSSYKFKHFDLIFSNPDWESYIQAYVAAGGIASELIEPVDGFHPSQSGNMLLAMNVWDLLEANYPDALGPVNPNNAAIAAKFGNQGGYS